jgi:pyrroline-5-carboxylate reductase
MNNTHPVKTLAFLGGGNMAEAFISGLVRAGLSADRKSVV